MTLKIAQVGMGRWGQDWAKNAIPKVEEIEVVAWVDASAETLKMAQKALDLDGERCFLTIDEMLRSVDVDGVLITAALPGHVPVAQTALIAAEILDEYGDEHSLRHYRLVAAKVPYGVIHQAMSEIKHDVGARQPARVFTGRMEEFARRQVARRRVGTADKRS